MIGIQAITQWLDQKATPLSAYGLIFLIILAAFFGLDKLAKTNSSALTALKSSQQELALLSAIDGQDIWEARKDSSAILKTEFDGALWEGKTAGAIAAQLQQNLRGKARDLKMKNIRVSRSSGKRNPWPECQSSQLNIRDAAPFTHALIRHCTDQNASF